VAWLHGFRYKNIYDVFQTLAAEIADRPIRVVEIGCAHAKLYQLLNDRFRIDYTGVEINPAFVEEARRRYGEHKNFRILAQSAADVDMTSSGEQPDIVVALETLEHIPEHAVVRIVENIARQRPRLFVCSVPVEVGPIIWIKNVGSWLMGYLRHTEYRWHETLWAGLYQLDRLPPHGTGHKGFDWRWLAQTIRHNLRIVEFRRLPARLLPAGLSTSVFFVARPREEEH
jgi:hypothetical protein